MAPHVSRVRKEHLLGKLLAFLSCLTTGIRSVFNYIVQLFKWDGVDPTDYAAQDGKSSLLSTAGDDCNSPVSRTDLEVQFQQSDELIRAKFKSKIFANINLSCEKVKEFKNCCTQRVHGTSANKKEEKKKKAVEQNDDTNKDHQGPKWLQCSGGNGSYSPTKNETAVKEYKQSNQTIGKLSHGHGHNNGRCEGDGNDPPKKNSNGFLKGHYRESAAEPVKNKDVLKCTSKLRLPMPESSGKDEKGSTKVGTSSSLNMDTVIPSGEADNHFGNVSSMMNGIESSAIRRNESSVTDRHNSNATDRNESSVTDGPESNARDKNESSVTDGPESNATDRDESSVTDGSESNATDRDESSVTDGSESNATDRDESSVTDGPESNATDRDESSVTDGPESNATDRNESSVMDGPESNATDRNESSVTDGPKSNATDRNESSVTDGPESNATDRDKSSVTDGSESNATDLDESSVTDGHESNVTGRNNLRVYNILYPFQSALSVFYDGFYRLERDFIILREICRGRFGVCFEILDISSGKTFAMKQISCKNFDANELKIWSKLTSDRNVVQLLGAYDNGKDVQIFMELMDGTLRYIAENREALRITDRKVAAVMKPILKVLASMHDQGYVHFDIKPDNILIDHSDIKLSDFGLTVDREETTGNIGLRGTVPYMPKELFCGGECGASADIYAAGCTVLHLLIGSPPWPGFVQEAIIWKVGCGETPEVPSNCSDQMKSTLKCMLQPDHEERPTAKEILLYPLFSDGPESVLDDVLQEVLVDVQLLQNQPSDDLSFSPMTLDGEDEEDEEFEGADPALPL